MGSRFVLRSLGAAVATLGLALSVAPAVLAAPMADTDGDGVFDDLENRVRAVSGERDLRVIVRLEKDATRARAAHLEERVGSLDVRRRFAVVDAMAAVVDANEVRELSASPGVAHVERDARVHAANASAQQWFGVADARIDLPDLDGDDDGNPATYSTNDLVAAVIDTGIHTGHTSLDGGKVLAFQDFTDGDHDDVDSAFDDEGHGTHVAATIAGDAASGDGRGVAPGAGLVGLKVLDDQGSGYATDVIAAIDWVWKDPDDGGPAVPNGVTYGIEAINLSLGASGCSDGLDSESEAVNAASNAGYVVAVAAGNDGPAGCTADTGISTPAAAANALTVGAMADVGASGFYLADFSSRGPTLDGRVKPDVAAPGADIRSAATNSTTGFATASGTSMATPFVAGVALLMRDLNPLLTPAQVKQKIMDTAKDWGAPGADSDHGAGRLDAYAALAASTTPSPPALVDPPAVPNYQFVQQSLAGAGADRFFTITAAGGHPLALGLTVANPSSDFDMYLYNAAGAQVAVANSPYRQDELHLASAGAGPYTLRVESWAGSGDFYLDVSGASALEIGDVPAPMNTSLPKVSGTPAVGNVLSVASTGGWTGTPRLTYEWELCSAAGTDCVGTGDVDGFHMLTSAYAGRGVRLAVTAESVGGIVTAYSALQQVPAQPPTVQGLPAIIGEGREGMPLTVTTGSWGGTAPIDYAFAWARCDVVGAGCVPISGASAAHYIPVAADVGKVLRATVTATNAGGSATASAETAAVLGGTTTQQAGLQPPQNELAPGVTGAARHGQVLHADEGTWRGAAPVAFAYEWLRCNSIGFDCVPIAGASKASYRVRAGDVERRIAVRVLASNGHGSAQARSQATGIVRSTRPVARKKPSILGRAARGRVLRAHGGTWWGTPTIRFSATWLRCSRAGRKCKPVARRAAYAPTRADLGRRLRVRITAVNSGGRRTATSRASAVVRSLRARDGVREAQRLTVLVAGDPDTAPRLRRVRLARG